MSKHVNLVLAALVLSLPLTAQTPGGSSRASELQSDNVRRRMAAFDQMRERDFTRPEIRRQLRDLLIRENQFVDSLNAQDKGPSEVIGEGYSEYFARVLGACDKYCDRSRPGVLQALATSSYNEDSDFALRLARDHGAAIVSVLTDRAEHGHLVARQAALRMLSTIDHENHTLTIDQRRRIHQATLAALDSSAPQAVRITAIQTLARIGNESDLPRLREIAESDPISATRSGKPYFPLREEAAAAINRLSKRPH